jgi:acetyltransferase-like isoleucine patch superfamily enzyme
VGKHCWIGPNCILDGSGGLEIGDYCSISAGTHIYTHNTVEWSLSGGEKPAQHKSVFIGNYVYIGPNAVIAMGTRIHDQCVIGALTFLNGDEIPPNSRVFGIPGKIQNSANINIQHPK